MFQLSFWEKQTYFSDTDVLVVGSGIVGLNAGISLKQKSPQLKILVIDRGFLPYGASTRNAGFACFGSLSEVLDDLSRMSETEVFDLLMRRWNGLKRLRSLLKDANIGYEGLGGFEVFTGADEILFEQCCDKINWLNGKLHSITGETTIYKIADNKTSAFGFNGVEHLICNRFEGQIDTGKMMKSLVAKAREMGIEIMNGMEINKFEEHENEITIHTQQGFNFKTKNLLVTTNGFAQQLLPQLDVIPARAQVLITEPIENLKIKGTFHYDKGYYYFRNVGNRLLFGGGRNLNFEGENTMEFGLTEQVQNKLDTLLKEMILPNATYKVEQRWSGIMGLGKIKTTIIKPISKNIFCAVRMGGMGIAIGSLVGEEAAEMIINRS